MSKIIKLIIAVNMIISVAILSGCAASPARYQSMIVKPTAATKLNPKLHKAIEVVNVSGGKKTNPLWVSKVDNDEFKKALEGSLNAYGYLVEFSNKAKYKLDATLLELRQPIAGFDLDVKSNVIYKVYNTSGLNKEYHIEKSGVATVSDALLASVRLQIANEKSIQENIKEFLRQLNSF